MPKSGFSAFWRKVAMVFFRYSIRLGLALMIISCADNEANRDGKEDPLNSIILSEIDVSDDFTSTSFKLANQAESTWYTNIVVIAEYRKARTKIGSERMVVYPIPFFGPDSSYVHEQPLHPASETDEVHFYVERASFYPEKELKAILENRNR